MIPRWFQGPWCRLPLTIRWLKQEHQTEFPLNKQPPPHMPVAFGLVQIVAASKLSTITRKKAISGSKISSSQQMQQSSQQSGSCSQQQQQLIINWEKETCFVCSRNILETSQDVLNKNAALMKCLRCACGFHTTCLAECFLNSPSQTHAQLLPVDGDCPKCQTYLIWGDLVRFQKDNFKLPLVFSAAFASAAYDGNESEDLDDDSFVEKDEEFFSSDNNRADDFGSSDYD